MHVTCDPSNKQQFFPYTPSTDGSLLFNRRVFTANESLRAIETSDEISSAKGPNQDEGPNHGKEKKNSEACIVNKNLNLHSDCSITNGNILLFVVPILGQ